MIKLTIYQDTAKIWSLDGKWHRANGYAVINSDGFRSWYVNDKCHRTDGPARVWPNGYVEYWINGIHVTEYELMFIEPTV